MKSHKGESQSEFLDRCVPEMIGTDENKRPREQAVAICLDIWRNSKQARQAPDPDPGESHSDFIDRCTSELEDEGTSARIDEIIRPVDAGILKAVSVGFKPIKHEPLDEEKPFGGLRFLEQELVETSLVSVPANPNALAVAKSLNVSRATMDLVFAEPGKRSEETRARGFSAVHGKSKHVDGKGTAMSLAQRISDTEALIVSKKDELDQHWKNCKNPNVQDVDIEKANNLSDEIAALERRHASLVASEKVLAGTTANGNGQQQRGNGGTAMTVYHAPAKVDGGD